MTDEPSNGELHRLIVQLREDMRAGFAQTNVILSNVVTTDALQREMRRVDDRHDDLVGDLADEKRERELGDARQQTILEKLGINVRWALAAVLIPIALFIGNLAWGKS